MLLEKAKELFRERLKTDNYSEAALRYYHIHLKGFLEYLEDFHKIRTPGKITKNALIGFIEYTQRLKNSFTGKKLRNQTVAVKLICARRFCLFMTNNGWLDADYSHLFEYRRKKQSIPANVLTETRMKKVLDLPDEMSYFGFRDKVIFEVLYGTGIRRKELVKLELYDINFEDKTIFIRQGKGKKDRIVPMGKYLAGILREYIDKVRPVLVQSSRENRIFVNLKGEAINEPNMGHLMKTYSQKAGFKFGCHTFRHSFATHMLKHGAGILYISKILGHEKVSTTEIYTKVYPRDLKKIILEMHPRSNERIAREEIKLPEKQFEKGTAERLKSLKKEA